MQSVNFANGQHGPETDFGSGGRRLRRRRIPDHTYQTGVALFIGAVIMIFAGLTSTLVVREASSSYWGNVSLPAILYVNTFILILSSLTFELAHRSAKHLRVSLYITFGLGILFLVGQLIAWKVLISRGVHLASTPGSSGFYLLTSTHAVHFVGGIIALGYLLVRMSMIPSSRFRAHIGAASMYWHFMSMLWIYILCLLARY